MIRRLMILAATLMLAACAQTQLATPLVAGFSGPHLEDSAFVSFDGARLGLSKWEAKGEPKAVIIGLHGMNDYAQNFWLAGPYWADHGITTYAFDQRGYGRSPRRGVWAGEDLIVRDVDTMVALVKAKYPNSKIAVVGFSMGGAAAVAAFSRPDAPQVDRLILAAPAVWGWSSQPVTNKTALLIANAMTPRLALTPPRLLVRDHPSTDNPVEMRRMSTDPMMLWTARPDALTGLMNLMQTAWLSTGRLKPPTLYLYGYRDEIIPVAPTMQAAGRLKPTDKTGFYRDGFHMLLADKQAWRVWDDIEGFIDDPAAPLVSGVAPIPRG